MYLCVQDLWYVDSDCRIDNPFQSIVINKKLIKAPVDNKWKTWFVKYYDRLDIIQIVDGYNVKNVMYKYL